MAAILVEKETRESPEKARPAIGLHISGKDGDAVAVLAPVKPADGKAYDKRPLTVPLSPRKASLVFSVDAAGDSNLKNLYDFVLANRPNEAEHAREGIERFIEQWNASKVTA